jgi:hypothetical protein
MFWYRLYENHRSGLRQISLRCPSDRRFRVRPIDLKSSIGGRFMAAQKAMRIERAGYIYRIMEDGCQMDHGLKFVEVGPMEADVYCDLFFL